MNPVNPDVTLVLSKYGFDKESDQIQKELERAKGKVRKYNDMLGSLLAKHTSAPLESKANENYSENCYYILKNARNAQKKLIELEEEEKKLRKKEARARLAANLFAREMRNPLS